MLRGFKDGEKVLAWDEAIIWPGDAKPPGLEYPYADDDDDNDNNQTRKVNVR